MSLGPSVVEMLAQLLAAIGTASATVVVALERIEKKLDASKKDGK